MSQIALSFKTSTDYSPHNFIISPCNEEAIKWINKWPEWPSHCIVIYGPESCGKSHIASIWQEVSGAQKLLKDSLSEQKEFQDNCALIEDIESGLDEEGLLHLYNRIKEQGGYLLLTSQAHPNKIGIKLPDLKSRLNSCPSIGINPPDDKLLLLVMSKLFADRQLKVGDDVKNYLLLRMERSFKTAEKLVEKIDKLSLQEKKNITIPLARKALELA